MEKEPVSTYLNSECLELPPLNDLKEIISEFESSGVDYEASIFKSPDVIQTDLENQIEDKFSVLNTEHTEKDDVNSEDKSSIGLLLDEKELSVIDFEIEKDIFNDIKIKEEIFEEPLTNVEQGSSHVLDDVLMAEKTTLNLEEDLLQKEVQRRTLMEENKEENFIAEGEKSVNEIEKIMAELQNASLLHSKTSNGYLSSSCDKFQETSLLKNDIADKLTNCSNISFNFNEQDFKKLVMNDTIHDSLNESTLPTGDTDGSIEMKSEIVVHEKTDECANFSKDQTTYYADSINSTIESVIQSSILMIEEEVKPEQIITNSGDQNSTKVDYLEKNIDVRKEFPFKKKTHGLFEVVVPLIGTNVMKTSNIKPFTHRYDLARQRNELRAKFQQKNDDFPVPNISCQEWRRQRESRSKEDIEKEEKDKTVHAIKLATAFTKIAMKILQEYDKDEPNEAAMIKYFGYFECAPASPLSLLYASHFVHTMMLIRADTDLSPKLRKAANSCYYKCHALFPIPEGYNFETVFTSEVKKNIPDEFNNLSDVELDYGDYDSSDFEDDSSDYSEDSDKDWEN